MKLNDAEVDNIYYLISTGFSQRSTAKNLGHSTRTIANYLNPKVVTDRYMDLYHKIADQEYDMFVFKNENKLWKHIAIVCIVGLISQVLINILY